MFRFIFISLFLASTTLAAESSQNNGYYQGLLGKTHAITMTLGMPDATIAGQYRYAAHGAPIWLTSVGKDENKIVLTESDRDGKASGIFTGTVNDQHRFTGIWSSGDGKRTLPFDLEKIADSVRQTTETSRYKVETFYPQFVEQTPFHQALNEAIATKAKAEFASEIADDEKATHDADAGPFPYEDLTSADIIHADNSLVSICYQSYSYSGGAHGMTGYTAVTYAWQNQHLVEVDPRDQLKANSRNALDRLLVQDLNRQNAGWATQANDLKFSDLVINPTSAGLMFTFGPYQVDCYAAGTFTVLLPYKSLTEILPSDSVLSRLVDPEK